MSDLRTTFIGAGAGAFAGFVASLFSAVWAKCGLHYGLTIEPQQRSGTRACVRVHNRFIFPMTSAYAYISIDHELEDVIAPPNGWSTFVTQQSRCRVKEDRLCWSLTAPQSNPPVVDIYSGERQSLDVVNFGSGWMEFPSEKGWASTGQISRVFLKLKRYRATIKIVSKDTWAKKFQLEIDPANENSPINLI